MLRLIIAAGLLAGATVAPAGAQQREAWQAPTLSITRYDEDWFDLAEYDPDKRGNVMRGLSRIRVDRALAIGVHTDILFPLQQQEQIADGLSEGGADARFLPLPSPQGHDAFLVDIEPISAPVA